MSEEMGKKEMVRALTDEQLDGVAGGRISFEPLEKYMAAHGITWYQMIKDGVLEPEDVNKMKYANNNYTMKFLNKLCEYLHCEVKDIIVYIPD